MRRGGREEDVRRCRRPTAPLARFPDPETRGAVAETVAAADENRGGLEVRTDAVDGRPSDLL